MSQTQPQQQEEEEKERWWKTTLANFVGAFILMATTVYFIYIKNTEGLMMLAGAVLGWFYGVRQQQQTQQ